MCLGTGIGLVALVLGARSETLRTHQLWTDSVSAMICYDAGASQCGMMSLSDSATKPLYELTHLRR
jgi:hypothetical protein